MFDILKSNAAILTLLKQNANHITLFFHNFNLITFIIWDVERVITAYLAVYKGFFVL